MTSYEIKVDNLIDVTENSFEKLSLNVFSLGVRNLLASDVHGYSKSIFFL